ncbi:BTB/POZ and MATH domain-containing protein 2-like [Setaria viridis]|uniref:BTB/POZ and MATH domain-containing protein 2-like n=1 Tax=Setaria viridis TaxID=4556 RepID=UPI000647D055|nr:BTB/POZ and MATH domain-containing protein 2-like [Setaria viridis]
MRESNAAGDHCIRIDDTLAQVFRNLLHFVYTDTDSLPPETPEMQEGQQGALMTQHLLEAADRYDLQRLKLLCARKLCGYMDVSTVATTLVLAQQHQCRELKEACIEFLRSPRVVEAVVATDGFEHLTKSCPALEGADVQACCPLVWRSKLEA